MKNRFINTNFRLVLASTSPRRRSISIEFFSEIVFATPDIDERRASPRESVKGLVSSLSLQKARSLAKPKDGNVFLAADTLVVSNGKILGKPENAQNAKEMLEHLRGRKHKVVSSVTVFDNKTGSWASTVNTSEVAMRLYSDDEISEYVESGESMDKAGAYAIQDEKFRFASLLTGCYLNVVGLPLCSVTELFRRLGIQLRIRKNWPARIKCDDCLLISYH